jgi:peptide/nickel transport system substrate-binding protein
MATGFWESEAYQMPRHYLIRFDPRYNPEYKDFGEFDIKSQTAFNPDRPSLCPWHLTAIEDGGFRMVLERNPYYFMTDTAGRQLPYIDKIICEYVPDPQIRVLKILSGEIDGQFGMMDLRDLALYVRGQKPGRYRLLRWQTGDGGQWQFSFNWSAPDPVIRSLIRDVRFREALSLAVDRDKCNQVALFGLAVPQQATISAQAWHFRVPGGRKVYDNWAKAYSRFDIAAANKLLDRMGLTKRDSSGFRLRPDGRRLSLLIDLPPAATEDISIDEATIVADGWRRLGIDVNLHNFTSAEFSLRMTLGKCEVTPSNETDMDLFTFPDWVFPTSDDLWHPLVGKWYATGGKQGEPPSGITKRLLDIYARILGEKDMAKSQQLILDAVKLETKQGFFCIGTVGRDPALVMAKENMGNVPTSGRVVGPWATPEPALSYPETFFFSSGARPAETGVRLN